MIVYLPILTLTGVEGKMFRPMALTVVLRAARRRSSSRSRSSRRWWRSLLARHGSPSARTRWSDLGAARVRAGAATWRSRAVGAVIGGGRRSWSLVACLLGDPARQEFVPQLDERDVAMHALRIPGTSLDAGGRRCSTALERALRDVPRGRRTSSRKIGTAEIANDPMPPNVSDTFVMLKPRARVARSPASRRTTSCAAHGERRCGSCPGNTYEFTQPIQMRFNELIAGVRGDVAVKVFGDDLETSCARPRDGSRAVLRGRSRARPTCEVEQVDGPARC